MKNSTLFQTNGVHLPDEVRILKKLFFDYRDHQNHYYFTQQGPSLEKIIIPNYAINRPLNNFTVWIERTKDSFSKESKVNCFSSLYE